MVKRPSTVAFSCTRMAGAVRLPKMIAEGRTSIRSLATMSALTRPATNTDAALIGAVTTAFSATVMTAEPWISPLTWHSILAAPSKRNLPLKLELLRTQQFPSLPIDKTGDV